MISASQSLAFLTLAFTTLTWSQETLGKPQFSGGLQLGYQYGQNGAVWPGIKNPLSNQGRGGFYISQLRLNAEMPIDSGFKAVGKVNVAYMELQEAYLEKTWGAWTFTAGRFRGAGLHSAMAYDEFEQALVQEPLYTRSWGAEKRLFRFRDLGLQVERRHAGGLFSHRLFLHNANGQAFIGAEPSGFQGPPTQVLGMDYGWDWKLPDNNRIGGHLGAAADREWDEFVGQHEGWKATYWFKTNPVVDGSLYHELAGKSWKWNSEMLLRMNRRVRNADSTALQSWGVMTQFEKSHTARYATVWRYEFFDPTDGYVLNDNLHLFTGALRYTPSPTRIPGFYVMAEYVRVLEEKLINNYGNDVFYVKTQVTF